MLQRILDFFFSSNVLTVLTEDEFVNAVFEEFRCYSRLLIEWHSEFSDAAFVFRFSPYIVAFDKEAQQWSCSVRGFRGEGETLHEALREAQSSSICSKAAILKAEIQLREAEIKLEERTRTNNHDHH